MELREEYLVSAEQCLDAQRCGDIRRRKQQTDVGNGHQEHAEHAFGAVDEGQALFLRQRDRLDTVLREQLSDRRLASGSVQFAVGTRCFAFAHEDQRAMGQRREVAGATQRTELADQRGDAGVEDVHHGLQDHGPDACAAGGQGLGAEEHDAADHFAFHGRTHAGGVAANQRLLQLCAEIVGGDVAVGQGTEARGNAVRRDIADSKIVNVGADLGHVVQGVLGNGHLGVVAGDGDDVFRGGDAAGAEGDGELLVGCGSHFVAYFSFIGMRTPRSLATSTARS